MPGGCDDFAGIESEDGFLVGCCAEDFAVAGDEADDEEGAGEVAPERCREMSVNCGEAKGQDQAY